MPMEMRAHAKNVSNVSNVSIKFDSGSSRNMSGIRERLTEICPTERSIMVKGFNDSCSTVDSVGINEDGKAEYFISAMPDNLVLLSANTCDYHCSLPCIMIIFMLVPV
jgi:hypothetical protein